MEAPDQGWLPFYLVEVKTGALAPRLFALQVGDRVWLGPKATGHFTLDQVPQDQNLILIATGTDLAPYMSMLRIQFEAGVSRRYVVIHGAGFSAEVFDRRALAHHGLGLGWCAGKAGGVGIHRPEGWRSNPRTGRPPETGWQRKGNGKMGRRTSRASIRRVILSR
jgi:hypothetical protein